MTSSEQQSFLRKIHVVLLLFSHLILSKCTSVHCYTVAFSSTGRSGITSAIKSSSSSLSLSLSPPRSKSYTTFLSQRESHLRYSSLSLSRLFSSQNSKHEDDELSELEPTSTSVNKNQNPTQSATTKKTISSKSDSKNKNDETNKNKNVPKSIKKKRRKMELSWCGRESCTVFEDGLREKVVGEHNEILFESPATGQVAYQWSNDNDSSTSSNSNNHDEEDTSKHLFRVLILIKWDDDELLMAASEAVHELTSKGDVVVMLPPDSAAKLKHYYGVDNDKIQLFDPNTKPHPRNLDKLQSVYKDDFDSNIPDLVCTLGGDGLLMYASNLFPGPCPPILCVAGGSLGFLTPFRRDEMVDCIRKSLGLKVETDDDQFYYDGHGESNSWYDDYAPEVPPYMASRMKPSYVDEDGITWTGSYRVPRDDPEESRKKKQTKFGSNNQIYISTRMRLECLVINREGVVRAKYNVLNEVVIDRGSSPYLAALECFCDNVHLTTVQADGIIFSTPTGSTAYSMAAGGSVVHPAVPAILVTPICPHVLSFRSMVFPDHVILRCYVPEDARADASVAFDGKHRRELQRGDSVQMQMSSYPVPTINRRDHSEDWLTSLKRNFNFNTRIRQSPLQNKHE